MAQLLEAVATAPVGNKRHRGHSALQQTQASVTLGCLPSVADLPASVAALSTVVADYKRTRRDEVSFSTPVASAVANPAASSTTLRSIFKYPDTRQATIPPLNKMAHTQAVAPQSQLAVALGTRDSKAVPMLKQVANYLAAQQNIPQAAPIPQKPPVEAPPLTSSRLTYSTTGPDTHRPERPMDRSTRSNGKQPLTTYSTPTP